MRFVGRGALLFLLMLGGSHSTSSADELTIQARIEQAERTRKSGANLLEAYRLLRGVDPERLRESPFAIRSRYLSARGRIEYELNHHDHIAEVSRQYLELAGEADWEPYRVHGMFMGTLARMGEDRILQKPVIVETTRMVIERAEPDSGLLFEAQLAMGKMTSGEESRRYIEKALETANSLGVPHYIRRARSEIARQLSRVDPDAGYALFREIEGAYEYREGSPLEGGWEAGLEISWRALPRHEAIDYSRKFLEEIEAWRGRQEERGTGSMGFFSSWIRAYRRVMGYILMVDGPLSREDLEQGFRISEQMRARVLLDRLVAGELGACADEEAARRRDSVSKERVSLQRESAASGADADRLRWRIENLLLEEEAIARDSRCPDEPAVEENFARLEEVERTLEPDEALLVFHAAFWEDIWGAFDGGSWVFVITRNGSGVFRLPGRADLQIKRDALTGAIRRRDGSEAEVAASLYGDLLGDVVPALPEKVRHLIIVPHGPIYGLPMTALRATPEARPLVDRYSFSYVPSATIWMSWRNQKATVRRQALAFANPMLGAPYTGKLWSRARDAALGPLPMASQEGRALVASLDGKGRSLDGEDASEHAFKSETLTDTGILLFAAHAVVDERIPKLSSIVLAPGSPTEDGLLQPPEISALDLSGKLVVLSACQSAGGTAIEGEGLLSLARSFFQAGATAVVGNMWPALDDEAAALFSYGYRNLSEGRSVARAFQEAQRQSMLRGDPAEAWAGVVVLGLGSARLEGGPESPWSPPVSAAWLLPVGAVLLWGLLSLRRSVASREFW